MEKNTLKNTVTEELCAAEVKKNVRFPFLSGVLRGTGELHFSVGGFEVEISHRNKNFVDLCASVIGEIYGEKPEVEERTFESGSKSDFIYTVYLTKNVSVDLLKRCKIVDGYDIIMGIPKDFLPSASARRAFLKGLFLSCGAVKVPENAEGRNAGYTLSFSLNSDKVKEDVIDLLAREAKIDKTAVRRKDKGNFVYIKNSEAVCNVLTAIGSVRGVLDTYDVIAERQVHNKVNRVRNCDIANIEKTVKAVGAQLAAIRVLEESGAAENLSADLKETCRLRKEFPDLGIEQLGAEFNPPVGKSCVNHRLRRICALAEEITDK